MGCNTNSSFSDKEKPIVGQKVNIDCLIGQPTELVRIDSLLMFYDKYDKQLITVFDVKNDRFVRRFMDEGQGPEEAIPPLKLFIDNGQLGVFQMQTGALSLYDVKDIVNIGQTPIAEKKLVFKDRPANIKPTQSGFVGIGMFDDGRYRLYDKNAEYIGVFGTYPFKGEEMDPTMRFFIYQGNFCSNGNHFTFGCSYCDNIEFYQIENNKALLVHKQETMDAKVQFSQKLQIEDDCVMNYKSAYGGDNYCYMLYSGKTYAEQNRRSVRGNKIRIFDWQGKYIQTFTTDKDIFSICVDEPDGILYAAAYDNNAGFVIERFNIN
ncbi:hypothetical protein FACS189426_05610 [Bacteroidia bacterium]|nr:hypothetical protein FACS189426_05610 [Bacteroidia bacterium]GHT85346.1 hypothetical protein FACS18947_3990 [Bacteroidia bacterium]